MQEIAPKLLTLMLWVRFLSQVNMLICPTIFQYHPVITVIFFARIQRPSRSNESTGLLLNVPMVFFFQYSSCQVCSVTS